LASNLKEAGRAFMELADERHPSDQPHRLISSPHFGG
jgi:hypothetical protein